jgi:hypothetical protein
VTLGRRIAAIRYAHKLAGLTLPTKCRGRQGNRRTHGSARVRKAPAVAGKMLGMVATAPDKLAGLRDRALLLIGFGGALRRSELVALDVIAKPAPELTRSLVGKAGTIMKNERPRTGPLSQRQIVRQFGISRSPQWRAKKIADILKQKSKPGSGSV